VWLTARRRGPNRLADRAHADLIDRAPPGSMT
jgi:hypothetical protein